MNVFKTGLGLVVLSAVLAGCSSTATNTDGNTGTPSATETSSSAESSAVDNSSVTTDEPTEVALETTVYFDFDQFTIKSEYRSVLTAHAEALKANPRSVRLEGHADERGTREYNIALGERRANAVRDFLVLQGVDSSLLETVSYGEEKPAVLGRDEQSWSQNRRVEIK
ncbi:peptidoglycan-associated lipoprotein Pal [Sessilibacter corallicola]|uniref:Peptidoglycan-associated lipoprotein n=1 Tax=Sessilibacter corallicola TaxID=2904075 RepID=A0ABQ0A7N8_9GAMM|nr:peptidoglycan-associated lipoprotein Pal [Sessilibacter corallicola]MCE2028824.1 peptidoglycan-associated lipoprotein Pal [Sessilibacter corallicola]